MLIDAHNHIHSARLAQWRAEFMEELPSMGLGCDVVNGTRESDWEAVANLGRQYAWVRPSFGLHPWYVGQRSDGWLEHLEEMLDAFPGCGVGEIGLDRWIEGYDLPIQMECFLQQLRLAAIRNLPATIHCVRAWGALMDVLRANSLPARGFLLHAYAGPAEMVQEFVRLGAFFSFSTYFLHDRKSAQREVFGTIPVDRLLVETDAPDMAPPECYRVLPGIDGQSLNDPRNIAAAYDALAKLRGMERTALECQVEANFRRWFGA